MTNEQASVPTDNAPREAGPSELAVPVTPWDHQLGPADAPVTLVEYGDYECPHCAAAHRVIEQVRRKLGDRLRIVYRHFPNTTSHPHAQHAAEAAELAGAQSPDAFWAMHALLYANQDQLTDDDLWRYAADLDLDMATFDDGFEKHLFAAKVAEDREGGLRSGVTSTPTIFLNGIRYDGSIEVEALADAVRRAAEKSSGVAADAHPPVRP